MITDIKKEREKKLSSMFIDHFKSEYKLMLDQISSKKKVSNNFFSTLNEIIKNDFSKDFGTFASKILKFCSPAGASLS